MIYQSWIGLKLTNLVVIGTDCTGSCKSNYHTITTTTAPKEIYEKTNDYLIVCFFVYIQYVISWYLVHPLSQHTYKLIHDFKHRKTNKI
jgi:hypothetical protein